MSNMSKFRAAVAAGRANLEKKRKEKKKPIPCKFHVVNDDGSTETFDVDVYPKTMSCQDYETFHTVQRSYEDEDDLEGTIRCSKYGAAVLVGAMDEDGKPIFTEDDLDLLEDAINATQTMRLAGDILTGSEITVQADAEKKPD